MKKFFSKLLGSRVDSDAANAAADFCDDNNNTLAASSDGGASQLLGFVERQLSQFESNVPTLVKLATHSTLGSGKTTFFKQVKLHHGGRYNEST